MKIIQIKKDLFQQIVPLLQQRKGTDASNIIYEYLDTFELNENDRSNIHDEIMAEPSKKGSFPNIFKVGVF